MKPVVVVTAAIIRRDGAIFIAQRGPRAKFAGLWEFPGGKVEPGEDLRACLAREINEEFGFEIAVGEAFETVEHDYGEWVIRLHSFLCEVAGGAPKLTEHSAFRWVAPHQLELYEFLPADIPIVERLKT